MLARIVAIAAIVVLRSLRSYGNQALQSFLTVSLYTVMEASLELCSLLTFNLLHLSEIITEELWE